MKKKTRFMAVMMAAVMGCRYSEAGALKVGIIILCV